MNTLSILSPRCLKTLSDIEYKQIVRVISYESTSINNIPPRFGNDLSYPHSELGIFLRSRSLIRLSGQALTPCPSKIALQIVPDQEEQSIAPPEQIYCPQMSQSFFQPTYPLTSNIREPNGQHSIHQKACFQIPVYSLLSSYSRDTLVQ